MAIAVLGHPFGAGQMTVKCSSRSRWLSIGINVQYDPRHFAPVGALAVGIKQTQVSHEMLPVIVGQRWIGWSRVSELGIKRWIAHLASCLARIGTAYGLY